MLVGRHEPTVPHDPQVFSVGDFSCMAMKEPCLHITACYKPGQGPATAINPSSKFLSCSAPVSLIYTTPQRGCLQTSRAEVERKIDDGRESPLGLGGQQTLREGHCHSL